MTSDFTTRHKFMCWLVHLYTSLGLPLNLASLWYLSHGDGPMFFALNLLAVAIDATDGMMARALRVKEALPYFNGAKLDDLIDYLTFTFLPAASFIYLSLVPDVWWPLMGLVLIASGYGFCQGTAKTHDAFVGFPSYWNLVALYAYLLDPPAWLAIPLIIALIILTFIPVHFVYPTRTELLRKTTLTGGLLYGVTLIYCSLSEPSQARFNLTLATLSYVVYYFIISAIHHYRVHTRNEHETC